MQKYIVDKPQTIIEVYNNYNKNYINDDLCFTASPYGPGVPPI